jgi:hypothetical protein
MFAFGKHEIDSDTLVTACATGGSWDYICRQPECHLLVIQRYRCSGSYAQFIEAILVNNQVNLYTKIACPFAANLVVEI